MIQNLFADTPASSSEELFATILENKHLKLERILSYGQATPAGEWYDQPQHEWVLLLRGRAGLRFESDEKIVELRPGDYMLIPAHKRHRVEWTDPLEKTVWLALHF
ncbi:MAG: cupin domain-containing protein [bacterium]